MADYPSVPISWRGYGETPRQYDVIKTPYENGAVQRRLRSTTARRGYQFVHEVCSAAEVSTLVAFWEARKGGVEPFNFTDPRTGTIVAVCYDGESPPAVVPLGGANAAFTVGPVRLLEAL